MKYVVKKITEEMLLSLDVVVEQINKLLINENGKINPTVSKLDDIIISRKKIGNLIDNIFYYTEFLRDDVKFASRVSVLLLGIKNPSICECGNEINKPLIYNGKTIGLNKYCSLNCSAIFTNRKRGYDFYSSLWKKSDATRKKNNNPYKVNEGFIKSWHDPEVRERIKQTNLKRYGVENPGVLGAYSSKIATKYIKAFLIDNSIDENVCYFKGGGVNGKEFYQNIYSEILKKFTYFSYDLVVFDDKMENIIMVLEYNGPWHYHECDYINNGVKPATPYKNSKTISETYEFDLFKLNHIKVKCDNILIYWEKEKELIKFIEKL